MKRLFTLTFAAVALAGCNTAVKPTAENYLSTINRYLPDHPDCLLDGSIRFPYETSDAAMTKKMDALVTVKVLEASREPAIRISRYTQTPVGVSAGPNLCFGFREATGIVSSTPPATADGFEETKVVYVYRLKDMPVWAKTSAVQDAFPVLAHEASGEATDHITLALTRVGWSVPN
jgi:hypothetical protein